MATEFAELFRDPLVSVVVGGVLVTLLFWVLMLASHGKGVRHGR
ncbi:hypothetical protein [Stenotrophomonas sp. Sm2017]|nr:hypothetical protein [Stenotrophomonas sp. Sm2017]MDQ7298024.1 hypothetical protein [Stenotrophomonas sp. Sm2017]